MSAQHEKCPFCPQEFEGAVMPATAGENAFLRCRTHVWMRHSDKLFRCGQYHVGSTETKNDFWRYDGKCSYCGSITQEVFFAEVEANAVLTPTDKNYKVYVGDNKEFKFTHLDDAGKTRFIEMYNADKFNMPHGKFYVQPFFARPK